MYNAHVPTINPSPTVDAIFFVHFFLKPFLYFLHFFSFLLKQVFFSLRGDLKTTCGKEERNTKDKRQNVKKLRTEDVSPPIHPPCFLLRTRRRRV